MSESPNLNPAALVRLHRLGGEVFVGKMIDLFIEFTAAKLCEARAAQASANLHGVEKAVHPVKSSAGNVGAIRVQELAERLELLAAEKKTEPVADCLSELEHAFAAVKPELEEKRRSLKLSAPPSSESNSPPPHNRL